MMMESQCAALGSLARPCIQTAAARRTRQRLPSENARVEDAGIISPGDSERYVDTMNSIYSDAAAWSRIQFAFTIIYHYFFPQLTMGLAWFLVYWKWRALRTGDEKHNQAVRFWAKI